MIQVFCLRELGENAYINTYSRRRDELQLAGLLPTITSSSVGMNFLLGILLLCGLAVAAKQPNILFILTDDQGKYMGGLEHMPKLQVCALGEYLLAI